MRLVTCDGLRIFAQLDTPHCGPLRLGGAPARVAAPLSQILVADLVFQKHAKLGYIFQLPTPNLMALLPQTPPSVGPHHSSPALHLPDIDDDEPLIEVLRQLSE